MMIPEGKLGGGRALGLYAIILGVTVLAYFPALKAGFIWNDSDYVTKPELQSLEGLKRILFEVGATEQYYPVLHGAFWFEHRLWGDSPLGYHLTNVLLHATAAWLFALLLQRLWVERAVPDALSGPAADQVERVVPNPLAGPNGRTSALGTTRSTSEQAPLFAALLFALHPVCVESVAWISEQKNTLSTVFYLLAALTYVNFDWKRQRRLTAEGVNEAEKGGAAGTARRSWAQTGPSDASEVYPIGGAGTRRPTSGELRFRSHPSSFWYALALALFILAILSKSVTATLPGALLVVAWWRRGSLSWKRDVLPTLPFFALGGSWGLFSAWVERTYVGAQGSEFALNAVERCLLAGRAAWFYLGKLFWPVDLIFIYPRWHVNSAVASQYLYPLAMIGLIAALWLVRKRARGPLAALLFFLGSLFPVCGLFNLFGFVFSYVADHWQYLPSLGVIALAAAGWDGLAKAESGGRKAEIATRSQIWPFHRFRFPQIAALAVICLLGTLTWNQSRQYSDIETFYRRTIEKNPGCWMAHTNLGLVLVADGRPQEAIAHYEAALLLDPYRPEIIHNDLGAALSGSGHILKAMAQFQEALRINPDYLPSRINLIKAHNSLGINLAGAGRPSEAILEFQKALRLDPGYVQAHVNLGSVFARERRLPEAEAEFKEALRLRPGYGPALDKLRQIQAIDTNATAP